MVVGVVVLMFMYMIMMMNDDVDDDGGDNDDGDGDDDVFSLMTGVPIVIVGISAGVRHTHYGRHET